MWSVTSYIIAGLGVAFLLLLLVLFTSFHIETRFCRLQSCSNVSLSFWWIHPFFISFFYNYRENDYYLRIVWWKMAKKKTAQKELETPEQPEDESVKEVKEESAENAEPEIGKMEDKTQEDTQIEQPIIEKVEKKPGKMDNLIGWIKKSWVIFFLSHNKWRGKMLSWLLRFFKAFRYLVHFEYFKADIRAGVEDPAVLGKIFGYYQAILNALQLTEYGFKIFFEPLFMKNHFEVDGAVKIKSSIGSLLLPFGVAFLTFPYINTFFLWRSYKRKMNRVR